MYIVIESFGGKVSGYKGQILELNNKEIIKDLLDAGYIQPFTKQTTSNSETLIEIAEYKKKVEDFEEEKSKLLEEIERLKESSEKGDSSLLDSNASNGDSNDDTNSNNDTNPNNDTNKITEITDKTEKTTSSKK